MENTRIINYSDLSVFSQRVKGKKIVLVGGCFDLFHIGHLTFLQRAKRLGNILIVLLESDEFIKKTKQVTPTHSQLQRSQILSELRCVDYVVTIPHILQDQDYEWVTQTLYPSIIAVTRGDRNLKLKQCQAQQVKAQIVEIDFVEGFSSSSLKEH